MTISTAHREAANLRAAALGAQGTRSGANAAPGGVARSLGFDAKQLRANLIERDGKSFYQLDGYASVVEKPYEIWDMFGGYNEVIDSRAFDKTLAADPDVAFLVNHRGVTMARTTNKTLELSVDALGLRSVALLNPERQDVKDLVLAVEDRNIDQMSFAFLVEDGEWSDDYSEFRITQVDLHRGDVSAVNYGANPHTSIAARSREIMSDLEHLPLGAARAAVERLNSRLRGVADVPTTSAPTGRSISLVETMLRLDD
ncbi:HK97 family phage prohead protease [Micromonospora sp. NPDC049044]|uniref:HK97 family phage prohead protease n=1 Tax=Micromonospora sp. NPDC049044 TaxID=3154827 RepID=UPI0033C5B60A